jgi:hypothetical protein
VEEERRGEVEVEKVEEKTTTTKETENEDVLLGMAP